MDNIPNEIPVGDKRRTFNDFVPALHPGLNDLIRILDKQAHCASRTLILCEPYVPSIPSTKYHQNCNSPTRRSSLESISRPSTLWNPCRTDNYYYDCFSYTSYLDRVKEYKNIDDAYNVLKNKDLDYSPLECGPENLRNIFKSGKQKAEKNKKRAEPKTELSFKIGKPDESSKFKKGSSSKLKVYKRRQKSSRETNQINTLGIGKLMSNPSQTLKSNPSSMTHKSGSIMTSPGSNQTVNNSVTRAELAEIRDLIRTSDDKNFKRLQEMLLLMKELSTKDFCRATCDKYDKEPRGPEMTKESAFMQEPYAKEMRRSKSLEMFPSDSGGKKGKLEMENFPQIQTEKSGDLIEVVSSEVVETKSASLQDFRTGSGQSVRDNSKRPITSQDDLVLEKTISNAQFRTQSEKLIPILGPAEPPNVTNEHILTIGNTSMTVKELVEISSLITDIVVIEVIKEMIANGNYVQPSLRRAVDPITNSSKKEAFVGRSTRDPPPPIRESHEEDFFLGPRGQQLRDESNNTAISTATASKNEFEPQRSLCEKESRPLEQIKESAERSSRSLVDKKVSQPFKKQGHPKHPTSSCRMKELDKPESPSSTCEPREVPDKSYQGSINSKLDPSNLCQVDGNKRERSTQSPCRTKSYQVPSKEPSNISRAPGKRESSPVSQYDDQPRQVKSESAAISKVTIEKRDCSPNGKLSSNHGISQIKQSRESLSPSHCTKEETTVCTDYYKDDSILYYARISENAFCPEKESYNAPGFMLKSAYDYVIPPRGKVGIKTDLLLELPRGSYGRLAPRKCLAMNFGIDVGGGVLDRDYKDSVTVLLFNHSDKPFSIKRGTKVAQLICERIHHAAAKENLNLIKT